MKTILRILSISALFAIGSGLASAADTVIGTWKLNAAKSTFSPGPAFKSQTRTYEASGDAIKLTIKTTTADGKDSTATLTFTYDGKPGAVSGNPDFDSVSVTRVDAMTVKSVQSRAGTNVGNSTRTVSKDGKTLTFAQKGTHADGTKYDDTLVYDKQ